jgi:hypothetical protein
MIRLTLAVVHALIGFLFTAVASAEPANAGAGWGAVTGRVVFDGDLSDPELLKRQANLPVPRGAAPQIEGGIPNLALLIDNKTRGWPTQWSILGTSRPARIRPL